ncbi:YtxH domain-containing protein [Bacillus sp. FJAT-45037]|uniref:YtxH domain-containing protein n=1 Tax=Bacillus sp. FJAT-45037 TaxID=2011007 RepID=UPI000C232559|nr:YtxH domain-containing protein [Bacillus sp. FJAT-45037]
MNLKSLLTGITVGATIAGVTTLLSTPTSGKEIQECCKTNFDKLRNGLNQFGADTAALKEQVNETTQLSIQSIKEVSTEVKDSIEDWKRDVQPSIDQLRQDTEDLQKRVEKMKQL